jgi:Tol biopolymer transport system component
MTKALCILMFLSVSIVLHAQLNLNAKSDIPVLVGEKIISTALYERDFAISPDGAELFYTLQSPLAVFQTIVRMTRDQNGKWSKPQVAPFAGRYGDLEPTFSPDGKKLFFVSNRPVEGDKIKDYDIWYVDKTAKGWGEPIHIDAPVNTSADEYYPAITKSGNIYYTASYPNGIGLEDIFVSKLENGKYQPPVPLDSNVNSKTYEFNAFVSQDEDFIIFTSYGRKDDKGRGDLYISLKDASGNWQPAKNLSMLNSDRLDFCPFITPDKKTMYFTSERHHLKSNFQKPVSYDELSKAYTNILNGGGNIYSVSFQKVLESLTR